MLDQERCLTALETGLADVQDSLSKRLAIVDKPGTRGMARVGRFRRDLVAMDVANQDTIRRIALKSTTSNSSPSKSAGQKLMILSSEDLNA